MQGNIVIAINKIEITDKLRNILLNEGYNIVATTISGSELIRIVRSYNVNLVIMGYRLADMSIIDIYNKIGDLANFLAIVNDTHKSFIQDISDIFCITSPINSIVLLNSIDMILQSQRKVGKYKEKINILEQKIEDRKIVDRAKGKLMKEKEFSEEEAFRYIQKRAMDNRKVIRDIANEILEGI